MKTKLLFILIVLVSTSCLDIVESIRLKKNGSGNYLMMMDLSQSEAMFNMIQGMMSLDSGSVKSPLDDIAEDFAGDKSELEKIPGISNVQFINKKDEWIFSLSFDFDNVDALNQALATQNKTNDGSSEPGGPESHFVYKNNTLERVFSTDVKAELDKANEEMSNSPFGNMLKDFSFTTEYIFDEKIKSSSNSFGRLSADGKKLTITFTPFDGETDYTDFTMNEKITF